MPVYEYKCLKCEEQIEVIQKMTDGALTKCESCGGELKKMITNTSFVLKGSGWYITDYPSADRKKAADSKTASASDKDKKTEKASEAKAASAPAAEKKAEKTTDTTKKAVNE